MKRQLPPAAISLARSLILSFFFLFFPWLHLHRTSQDSLLWRRKTVQSVLVRSFWSTRSIIYLIFLLFSFSLWEAREGSQVGFLVFLFLKTSLHLSLFISFSFFSSLLLSFSFFFMLRERPPNGTAACVANNYLLNQRLGCCCCCLDSNKRSSWFSPSLSFLLLSFDDDEEEIGLLTPASSAEWWRRKELRRRKKAWQSFLQNSARWKRQREKERENDRQMTRYSKKPR